MGFANVRAGTVPRNGALSTRVPFCIAAGKEVAGGLFPVWDTDLKEIGAALGCFFKKQEGFN